MTNVLPVLEVAIDVGPLRGYRTGIGNAVAWYLKELERRACQLDVSITRYLTSARAATAAGERRLPIPATLAHRWWARADRPRLDRWIHTPDVVHGTNYVVPPSAAPRLVSVYDCWFLDHPEATHRHVRLAGTALLRALRDGATAVVSSAATATRLAEHVDTNRIVVVHLGPPIPNASDGEHPDRPDILLADRLRTTPFVLSIGTIERRKNIPTLVAAFDILAAEHPTVRLIIVGPDGDDQPAVSATIDRLGSRVSDRIIRTGIVSEATKRWLLDQASVVAYPSLDEGFGFPLLEAQQAGVPIVASTAGSIPEIAGGGARYAAPNDGEAFAAQLFCLLDDEAERARLIAAGVSNLNRFSWSDCVDRTVGIYRQLADN